MPAERHTRFGVPCLRGLAPELRRARLLAARAAPRGYAMRRGILSGAYDGGQIVGAYMKGQADG